jgi:hypothetical protein
MKLNITKIAQAILYMLHKKVNHLNDKKLSILLFLIDYNHHKFCGDKIFGDEYIKTARYPQPVVLSEIFDIIANSEDLEEDDERLFIIQEMFDYIDIEIIEKEKFIELTFLPFEDEEFDEEVFEKEELRTITKIINEYKDMTPRNIANACFKIELVRQTSKDDVIF